MFSTAHSHTLNLGPRDGLAGPAYGLPVTYRKFHKFKMRIGWAKEKPETTWWFNQKTVYFFWGRREMASSFEFYSVLRKSPLPYWNWLSLVNFSVMWDSSGGRSHHESAMERNKVIHRTVDNAWMATSWPFRYASGEHDLLEELPSWLWLYNVSQISQAFLSK